MYRTNKVYENENVEKVVLNIDDEEIEILNSNNESIGKITSKQIVKTALKRKSLRFRIKEALEEKIDENEKLPSLKDIYFDQHLLLYGKRAEEVKTLGVSCPICGVEIDEYGYCGCGSGSA
ncbi:sulfolobus mercury resistance protein, MerI [Sulfolobus sp. A20]|uniref:sulfolobus mercury resistance protein, MerI n=1 Tax=Sulfolobaceae TaxID=118883 RepID=UPI000845ECAD|nr:MULTISPECIES: sulfolobus mercury resistance protein, MerI [unclassified Sulfolobus]TRM75000.1 sulfolobus mercury resistance protein, MerI [Sulfolobus sp. E5]TRM75088.1 sulfolobus mercury resistance protein, MerI [Sulfolobus sp. A20-N-F8]TRM79635.1 sulfolobus mercury resistance protein, MerI [Sulfolobus sp. B5]TRM81551.1 sulfolobus mercury resistance protein, MerI [Sulfolobus sp. D5]TRM83399.1 sulfolobus mercury resistance protein, MerI [Sulfolobus sp. A20-N-F6]TRM89056.1 sulfolobus mercury